MVFISNGKSKNKKNVNIPSDYILIKMDVYKYPSYLSHLKVIPHISFFLETLFFIHQGHQQISQIKGVTISKQI